MLKNMFLKMRYVPAMLVVLLAAPVAHAATAPSLGAASSFSVLAALSMAANGGGTTVSGDLGLSPGLAVSRTGVWSVGGTEYFGPLSLAGNAQTDALNAYNILVGETTNGGWSVGPSWSPAPGVYTIAPGTDETFTGTITLNGGYNDVWVFQLGRDLTFSGTIVMAGNAQPCNVFWQGGRDATIASGALFSGTLIASGDITLASGAVVNGRMISLNSSLVLNGTPTAISGPTCVAAPAPVTGNGPPIPPLINVRKVPSPLNLPAGPGPVTYTYTVTNPGRIPMHDVTLTDDKCSNVKFVSGDTNNDSLLDITETWMYTCTTTLAQTTINYATARGIGNDMAAVDTAIAEVIVGVPVVPPLIHIVKTPNPLTLPNGGGSVTYSYTVTNPGTVALTDVTVTDNKCANVTRVSGDTNGDLKLQSSETWTYTCTMNIPQTTVNTAIATGHANGLTAIDTALATVVVEGLPIPPLIHIIKKADPIILPSGGGVVAYSYSVTNPGTVPLNNVTVTDDKCTAVTAVSGDGNGNGLLETNEVWMYTCNMTLRASTTNTATAQGTGNGLTVTDVAVASVVLSPALIPPAPKLPNTGFAPVDGSIVGMVTAAGIFVGAMLLFAVTRRKHLS